MPTAPPTTSDASVEAQVFWLRFQKEIAAALIIAILAMIGYAGYRLYAYQRDSKAAQLLGSAKTASDYQQVISQYPQSPAGITAYLLLAETQRRDKKFDQANTTLRTFLEKYPDHEMAATAKMAIASNLEAMGKTDEALSTYQEIAAKYPNDYNGPLAMISEVPLLKAKNRIDDARRVCEEILTKYRMPGQQAAGVGDDRLESIWAAQAMGYLRTFKLPEQPKAASAAPNAAGPKAPPLLAAPSAAPAAAPTLSAAPTPKK
jgi:predicted negative regulator of RcsB-dependent stress response